MLIFIVHAYSSSIEIVMLVNYAIFYSLSILSERSIDISASSYSEKIYVPSIGSVWREREWILIFQEVLLLLAFPSPPIYPSSFSSLPFTPIYILNEFLSCIWK